METHGKQIQIEKRDYLGLQVPVVPALCTTFLATLVTRLVLSQLISPRHQQHWMAQRPGM
jgi:hypothetical protein